VAQWASGVMDYFKKHPLISHIASDAALAAFGIALGVKMKKAFSAAKDILGFGKQAAQLAATTANTVAIDANTAALLGKSVSDVVPKTTKIGTVINTVKNVGSKVGKVGKVAAAAETIIPVATIALADLVGQIPMQTKRLNEKLLKKYEPQKWKEIEQLLGGKTELGKYHIGTEWSNKGQIGSNISHGAYVGKFSDVMPLGDHKYQTFSAPKGNAAPKLKIVTVKIQ